MPALPPLRYRLANPPAVFVGRAAEREHLAAALARGRLSFVWGLGGVGKSSLVSAALHAEGQERTARTVVVDVRPGDEIATALATAAGAMTAATGAPPLEARTPVNDLEALVASALEIAEETSAGWTVVLDDLHHAEGDVAYALSKIERYARSSRWIVTSRTAPPAEVEPAQVIALGGLDDSAIAELARAIVPGASDREIRLATRGAGGSPWRLQQLIAGRQPATEPGADPVLESLDETALDFLRALSVVEIGLRLETAAQFVDLPTADTVRALERRGVLERRPAGVRVHDVTRSLLESTSITADDATRARAAEVLSAHDDIQLVLEGLRLFIQLGDNDRAREVLDRRSDELLAPEMLLSTEQLLRGVVAPELYGWCLRAAVERGDASAVARLGPPTGTDPDERFLWARARRLQGELESARQTARVAADAAAAEKRSMLRIAARTFEVQCAMACSDYLGARELLNELEREAAGDRLMIDMYQARCAVELDDTGAVRRYAERLRQWAAALQGEALRESGFELAAALHHCGELRAAEELIGRVAEQIHGSRLASYRDRLSMEVVAFVAAERGRLDVARAALESVSDQPVVSPFVRLFRDHIEASRRLYAGELAGLDAVSDQLFADSSGRDDAMTSALNLGWRLAALRNEPDVTLLERRSAFPSGHRSRMPRLCRAEYYTRRGEPPELGPELLDAGDPAVRAQARIVAALAAIPRQPEHAVELAREAAERANAAGFGALQATAIATECDARAAAGDVEAQRAAADRLTSLARAMPSTRFELDGRLHLALTSPGVLEPGLLETLAAAPDASPVACRRARALLGGAASLDRIDQIVVAAATARAKPWKVVGVGGSGWGGGLVIDERSRCVWLADQDEPIAFERKPLLWRLLLELARAAVDSSGEVGKETLVRKVWGVDEYHPLRHDNKLHAAIKNLRKRIEVDPGNPNRILTTEEGYRLGTAQPVRRVTRESTAARGRV